MARISSAVLTQVNGVAPAFHSRVKRSIAAVRTRTFSKLPRRRAWRVRMPNHVSTWFIQDALVGREVEGEARVPRQPRLDVRRLVGADVVEHDVDLAPRVRPGQQPQEGEEVVAGVPLAGLVGDLPGRDLERREQADRVPLRL